MKRKFRRWLMNRWGLEWLDKYGRISYAQEGEDVIIERIMEPLPKNGTYVDVGANHPVRFSNTARMYRRGWRGVVVEPNLAMKKEYSRLRPEDKFLNFGVALSAGELTYFQFDEPCVNTFSPEERNKTILAGKFKELGHTKIQCLPLKELLSTVWPSGKAIDLLSVDVEGMDDAVLRSHDFERYPTSFIICESQFIDVNDHLQSGLHTFLEEKKFFLIAKLMRSCIYKSNRE